MNLSAIGYAGATALCVTLWSQQSSAQSAATSSVYAPPPPTASVYSPAPSRDYPSLAQPSSSSRVIGYIDREETCRGFDCLPTNDGRIQWFLLISALTCAVGIGTLEIIRRHKDG